MILAFAAAAFLTGAGVAALEQPGAGVVLALAATGGSLGLMLSGDTGRSLAVALIVLAGVAGYLRFDDARPAATPSGLALLNDGPPALVRGVVASEPEERERFRRFTLRVDEVEGPGGRQPVEGFVLVTARLYPRFEYGDRLELQGSLKTPPSFEGFDYREYLARQGVVSLLAFPQIEFLSSGHGSQVKQALIEVRRPFGDALERSMPEPEAALAQGILLGQRASIPKEVSDDFNAAGVSHLVAISGYNVMLLAGLLQAGLSWLLGRRRAPVAAMILVVVFAAFVGGSASVLRATVMAEVMLGAVLAGRPGSALGAVVLAGAGLVAWQPSILEDVGFQLSLAATIGIVLLASPLTERALAGGLTARLPSLAVEMLSVTSAASLAVLPVIAASFGRVSLVALPANLLAVPAFPLVLLSSFITAVVGALSDSAGRLAGEAAYLPLAYLVEVAKIFSEWPGASVSIEDFGLVEALISYALLGALAYGLRRRRFEIVEGSGRRQLRPAVYLSVSIAVMAVFVWFDALSETEQRLTVTVLDVGQGDAILIETPGGRNILVDGGPSGPRLMQALGEELPASTRRLDLVVLTHAQDDHLTGLIAALERYDVPATLAGRLGATTAAYAAWQGALTLEGAAVHFAAAGEWLDLGGGIRLEVLAPGERLLESTDDDLNNNSVVLRLAFGEISFLLTGDLAAEGEEALLNATSGLRSTVLKVGHHGSDGSTTPGFLAAVSPRIAVISAGAENTHGHPHPTTQLRLAGIPYFRTDENGSVRLQTDGRNLWAESERGVHRMTSR